MTPNSSFVNYNCFARVFFTNNETKSRNIFKIDGAQVKKHCFPFEIFLGNVTLIWAKKTRLEWVIYKKIKKRNARWETLFCIGFFLLLGSHGILIWCKKKLDHGWHRKKLLSFAWSAIFNTFFLKDHANILTFFSKHENIGNSYIFIRIFLYYFNTNKTF